MSIAKMQAVDRLHTKIHGKIQGNIFCDAPGGYLLPPVIYDYCGTTKGLRTIPDGVCIFRVSRVDSFTVTNEPKVMFNGIIHCKIASKYCKHFPSSDAIVISVNTDSMNTDAAITGDTSDIVDHTGTVDIAIISEMAVFHPPPITEQSPKRVRVIIDIYPDRSHEAEARAAMLKKLTTILTTVKEMEQQITDIMRDMAK